VWCVVFRIFLRYYSLRILENFFFFFFFLLSTLLYIHIFHLYFNFIFLEICIFFKFMLLGILEFGVFMRIRRNVTKLVWTAVGVS